MAQKTLCILANCVSLIVRTSVVALGVLLIISAAPLAAQTSTSIISGTVTDASGAVVAGANVDVRNVGTGIVVNLKSDAQGRYRASELVIGEYEVQAEIGRAHV